MPCVPDGRVDLGDFCLTASDAGVDLQPGAQAAGHDPDVSHRDDNTDPASPWHARCSGTGKSHDLEWLRETHVSSLWLRAYPSRTTSAQKGFKNQWLSAFSPV